jgi:hypothetical protein
MGQVLTQHPITNNLTQVYVAKNGILTATSNAIHLFNGPYSSLAAVVLEGGVSEVAGGRVLVLGDKDMLTDWYMATYAENRTFSQNLARWATSPAIQLKGNCALDIFQGDTNGVPVELKLYQQGVLVETIDSILDSASRYDVLVSQAGTYKVVAKPSHWLSVKQEAVAVAGITSVDWDVLYNGDLDYSNLIGLTDLAEVLLNYMETGPNQGDANGDGRVSLTDLAIILLNFRLAGEQ